MRHVALFALAAVVIGCGVFVAPSPTPAEMDDVIANLVLRGVSVHDLISGDPGCSIETLQGNAVHMEVALGSQSSLHTIYLLRWRRPTDFAASAQGFADCVAEYQTLHPEQTVNVIEANPWRAYGADGSEPALAVLFDALHAAGGANNVSSMAP